MSTDLRTALREAVTDDPPFDVDPRVVIAAGGRRGRRRTGLAVGASALVAAALVVAAAMSGQEHRAPDPAPAEVDRLDLDDAVAVDLDVLAQTRTTWRDAGKASLEYDRFEGLTDDGLVLRGRYTNARSVTELGLLDPGTGVTDWLPLAPADAYGLQPLALEEDRLVLGIAAGNGHSVMVFDRTSRTWQRDVVRVPNGIEVHVPPRMMFRDERVFIGSTLEDGPTPIYWWSAPVPGGGDARPEVGLEGAGAAWSDQGELVAHEDGRVVLTTPAGARQVAAGRPRGCEVIDQWPDAPPLALLAGERAVVTWFCESGPVTVVYDGPDQLQVAGAVARAGDERHLLLAGATGPAAALGSTDTESAGTYLLDLGSRELTRIDDGPWESATALRAGLVLWNTSGPMEDRDTYDVVWKVATVG